MIYFETPAAVPSSKAANLIDFVTPSWGGEWLSSNSVCGDQPQVRLSLVGVQSLRKHNHSSPQSSLFVTPVCVSVRESQPDTDKYREHISVLWFHIFLCPPSLLHLDPLCCHSGHLRGTRSLGLQTLPVTYWTHYGHTVEHYWPVLLSSVIWHIKTGLWFYSVPCFSPVAVTTEMYSASDPSAVRSEQKLNCIQCFSSFHLQSRAPTGIKSSCLTAGKKKTPSAVCWWFLLMCRNVKVLPVQTTTWHQNKTLLTSVQDQGRVHILSWWTNTGFLCCIAASVDVYSYISKLNSPVCWAHGGRHEHTTTEVTNQTTVSFNGCHSVMKCLNLV